jgi:hypothetical protein
VPTHQTNFQSRHYSYECKAKPEERPYAARPSRSAQLKNPKLAPKLTSDVPNDLLRKKGTADEVLAAKASERGRKRSRSVESYIGKTRRGASRSMSMSSVSTISTAASRSASPPPPPRRRRSFGGEFEADGDSYMTSQNIREAPRKRTRRSLSASTNSSYASHHSERNTRRRRKSKSPASRGRRRSRSAGRNGRSRSRSITHHAARRSFEGRPRAARDEPRRQDGPINRNGNGNGGGFGNRNPPYVPKERSMSPYSKRLALTQSMN